MDLHYKDSALIDENELSAELERLRPYRDHLAEVVENNDLTVPEASINLPGRIETLEEIEEMAAKVGTKSLRYVLVIGIGGSNLGAQAIYNAIYGKEYNFLEHQQTELLFLDTVSPTRLKNILDLLRDEIKDPRELLVNVVSKSGSTNETIANFKIVLQQLQELFPNIQDRFVFTTDKGTDLWNTAQKEGAHILEHPQHVGGRYSVLSVVGLFPLYLAGVDTKALLEGASSMVENSIDEDFSNSLSRLSAGIIYIHAKRGIRINNSFFFNPELESVGKWYRQLMGESIGKQYDVDGTEVNSGITPIVSIGSTDLHSMAQLYYGGPHDKLTNIVFARHPEGEFPIPDSDTYSGLVESLKGKSAGELMDAIIGGVKKAYENNGLPYVEVELPGINERSIGSYMQMKMVEMMYLAKLMNLNAFDQPSVEDYKLETKKLLKL
ncbi:MAG: hypothetical protein ACE5DX_02330 [Candidatus Dojkabacteria bacterium]